MPKQDDSAPVPSSREIASHLKAICRSEALMRSKRGQQILRYLITTVNQGESEEAFTGFAIGMAVFGFPIDHDHAEHPAVRVAVGDLRKKLSVYYETEGRNEPIRIRIPVGSYVPDIFYEKSVPRLYLSDRAARCVANAKAAVDQRTLSSCDAAIKYLETALKDHSGHPRLLALQAMIHVIRAGFGGLPSIEIKAAESLIARARLQGHETWEILVAEAEVKMALYFEWEAARQLFNRAIKLSRGEARFNLFYAAFLACQLQLSDFLRIKLDIVTHLMPNSAYARCELSLAQVFNGQMEDAAETLTETVALFPKDQYMPNLHLALLHEAKGEFEDAALAMERIPTTLPDTTLPVGLKALMLGLAGQKQTASGIYRELEALRKSGRIFIPASQLAVAAMGIGEFDEALKWYTEAVLVDRDPIMNWIAILPFNRHIRHHPGFEQLVTDTMKLRFPG